MKFRCPVCAKVLNVDVQQPGRRMKCPGCESTFNPDRIRQLHAQQQQLKANQTLQSDPLEKESNLAAGGILVTPQDEYFEKTGNIKSNSPNLIQLRRRNSKRRLIGFAILAFVAVGSILGLVHILQKSELTRSSAALTVETPNAETATAIADEETTKAEDSDHPGTEATDEITAVRESQSNDPFQLLDAVDDSFKKPNNTIKSARLLNDIWFKVRPFLVEIRAETPFGSQFATGTIVDSRGWILTSYRSVAGATRIDIRQARKSLSDESDVAPLVDQVRGFIAADLEHDLMLLAINPRFVVSFNDLPVANVDKLVGSQYLIQCMPPTQRYPWPVVESRIDRRIPLAEMDSRIADKMMRIGFQDRTIRWIQHQQLSPLRAGAPLFNDEGQLVAMNTAGIGATEQDVLAVPARLILELKQLGQTELQRLPVPQIGVDSDPLANEQEEAVSVVNREPEMTVVHSGSSLRELSETINRLGSECQLFGWWPTTNSETKILVDLSAGLIAAKHRMMTAHNDPDVETLRRQTADWTEKMIQQIAIGTGRARDAHFEFNQRLVKNPILSVEGNRIFIGFAFVEYSAMESPKMAIDQGGEQDSIVFEFSGSDRRMITNLSADWPPLPPDSLWLIIGEQLEGQVRLKGQDQASAPLQKSKVHFVLQANAP